MKPSSIIIRVITCLALSHLVTIATALKLVDIDDEAESILVQTDSQLDSSNGIRLTLKRRQKYLYDYFFPKNMRDDIELKEAKKQSPSLAQ